MKDTVAALREFHTSFDAPILETPEFPSLERIALRINLIDEEHRELIQAIIERDIVETADALADLIYVIVGTALEFGIPLDRVFAEVHRSNMAKVDPATGHVLRREDGKILKPDGWTPPDIRRALFGEPTKVKPVRLRLSRKAGFNLQDHSYKKNGLVACTVARPSMFGNPFTIAVAADYHAGGLAEADGIKDETPRQTAVRWYQQWLAGGWPDHERKPPSRGTIISALKGKNLACWCGISQVCHADVLLEIANA